MIEEHDKRLQAVLERARSVNLKPNHKKSKICLTQVSYIGHVLTQEGVKPVPARVQAIVDMPPPSDKNGVQRFLGMISYVHKCISNMSEIAKPLRTLLSKDIDWHWQHEQEAAFQMLKKKVKAAQVLSYYNVRKPITLQIDACRSGLGDILL